MSGELERAGMRVSTADRERMIEHLQECTSEGRLELDEFTERVDAVYAAKTYGELDPIVSDLPVPGGTVATPSKSAPAVPDEIAPTGSAERRKGRWLVPPRMTLRPRASSLLLDFANAEISHPEVDISVAAGASSLTMILPKNSWAETKVDARFSSFTNLAQRAGDETGVRFVIHGEIIASSMRIRRVRRFLWWEY